MIERTEVPSPGDGSRPIPPDTPHEDDKLALPGLCRSYAAPIIVTMDGPAGSGKSSTAMLLAERLGGVVLHTGRHYRAVALVASRARIDLQDHAAVAHFVAEQRPFLDARGQLCLNGVAFTVPELEAKEVDALVGEIGRQHAVRWRLITEQRNWVRATVAEGRSVVIEGRDAGTRVAPQARFRFFLHASVEERAARRWTQQASPDPRDVYREIVRRDAEDRGHGRTTLDTPGIIPICTENLSMFQVLEKAWRVITDTLDDSQSSQSHTPDNPDHNAP
jgi:cytidylate kinase